MYEKHPFWYDPGFLAWATTSKMAPFAKTRAVEDKQLCLGRGLARSLDHFRPCWEQNISEMAYHILQNSFPQTFLGIQPFFTITCYHLDSQCQADASNSDTISHSFSFSRNLSLWLANSVPSLVFPQKRPLGVLALKLHLTIPGYISWVFSYIWPQVDFFFLKFCTAIFQPLFLFSLVDCTGPLNLTSFKYGIKPPHSYHLLIS